LPKEEMIAPPDLTFLQYILSGFFFGQLPLEPAFDLLSSRPDQPTELALSLQDKIMVVVRVIRVSDLYPAPATRPNDQT
jgi:hypothetical protein